MTNGGLINPTQNATQPGQLQSEICEAPRTEETPQHHAQRQPDAGRHQGVPQHEGGGDWRKENRTETQKSK